MGSLFHFGEAPVSTPARRESVSLSLSGAHISRAYLCTNETKMTALLATWTFVYFELKTRPYHC